MEIDSPLPTAFPPIRTREERPRRSWPFRRRRRAATAAVRLRWYQFTLRRLLLLVLLVSVPLAWLGRQGLRHVQRRRAAAQVVALGGHVYWNAEPLENTWYGRDLTYVSAVYDGNNPHFPASALELLGDLPGLQCVSLSASQFDDASLTQIVGLADVESLMLASPAFTDAAIAKLESMPRLRCLHLCGPQFTDGCVAHVAHLPHLQMLRLANVGMSGAGLREIRRCSNLSALYLDGPWVNVSCLEGLAGMNQLTQIAILSPALAPDDFAHLEQLPGLIAVQLVGSSITDGSLKPLLKLPRLSVLQVYDTQVTSEGLADLRGARLVSLELMGGQFDDGCIEIIKSMSLRRLTCGSTPISEAAIAELKRAKPALEIIIPQRR